MVTELKTGLLFAMLLGACGCLTPQGNLFTRTTVPYALPYENARRVGAKSCRVDITQLREPLTRANLSVMWTNRAVADALKRAGMSEVRYADLETLSILNSTYERRRLVFYGE